MSKRNILDGVNRVLSVFDLLLARKSAHSSSFDFAPHYSYASGYARPTLIMVPVSLLRWKSGRIRFDDKHPFVKAAIIIDNSKSDASIYNFYTHFYSKYQPEDCSDIVECFEDDARIDCFSLFRHRVPWPWVEEKLSKDGERDLIFQNGKYRSVPLSDFGSQNWGPVSLDRIEHEIYRMKNIVRSVRQKGFMLPKFFDNDSLTGYILRNGQDWVCVVDQGQHRVSVASALGITEVPVFIQGVFDFDFCAYFPKVLDGLYSVKEARDIFKRFIVGEPIPLFSDGCVVGEVG